MAAEGRDFAPPVSQAGVKKPPPLLPIGCVDALGNGFRDACKRAGIERGSLCKICEQRQYPACSSAA